MNKFTKTILAGAVAISAIAGAAIAADNPMVGGAPMYANKNIVENAVNSKDHTTLVAAVKAAGLVETLQGKGPFTVFAPTNAAFAKLPAGTVDDLLKPENKEKLKGILLYHVHAGDAIKAADVKTMKLSTANGKDLMVKVADDKSVWINDAKVIKTDVICSNGVIHWIDTVVMP